MDFDEIRKTVRGEQAGAFSIPICMEWLGKYEEALAAAERAAEMLGELGAQFRSERDAAESSLTTAEQRGREAGLREAAKACAKITTEYEWKAQQIADDSDRADGEAQSDDIDLMSTLASVSRRAEAKVLALLPASKAADVCDRCRRQVASSEVRAHSLGCDCNACEMHCFGTDTAGCDVGAKAAEGLPVTPEGRVTEVAELVKQARTACDDAAKVASDVRDYDHGASPAEWDAVIARGEDATKRHDTALSRLATLALGQGGRG